ncbi:MAG: peroxiredoxin [Actinomycetaceae bacterium]|nr:peroxiredoxin [Actinomycetaceae bacterium]
MGQLAVGDKAPDFSVETVPTGGFTLSEALAQPGCKGVIVYFYPKASTPGCTKEACDFRDSFEPLKAAGYTVIGLSPDKLSALEKFANNHALSFPLGSDPDKTVAVDYGAWGEKKNYGRMFLGLIRSTIVVGAGGLVTHAFYNVKATGHVERLKNVLSLSVKA